MAIVYANMKLSEVVEEHPSLIPVVNRFGIRLGLGDKNVRTLCAGIEAAMEAKADIVVLCSSDDEYAEYAVPAFQALAGRAMFIVAGAPACMDELKAAGIENFIHVRVNVLETLREYNKKLL